MKTTPENRNEIAEIEHEISKLGTLGQVLDWAQTKPKSDVLPQVVADVIVQDEYAHDVIIPFRDLFLVFDTT